MNGTAVTDLFHAMRLAANGVIADPEETSMSIVENQSLALAKLFEQTFDELEDTDDSEGPVEGQLYHFWCNFLKEPLDSSLVDLRPKMTACYALLWSLGYGNDRQEIYDGALQIATRVVQCCDELLGVPEPEEPAIPKRPPRGKKPRLVHSSEKK